MKLSILLTSFLLLLAASAQDLDQNLSPAEQLLDVMRFEKSIVDGGMAGYPAVEQSLAGQNLTEKEMAEVKDAFMAYMLKLASDPDLKAKTIKLYEKTFTNDEILGMIEFYKTPLGQKTLHELPQITGEAMQFSMELAQKHVGAFQDALTGILERKAAEKPEDDQ